ncbi:alkylglycerol monooxygenase [Petromyzon marinus]|uniref:alkylglycerol monooxygenase n=1 Tax=Petromyzon marinus TaxID=7757 RepID=UPI003F724BB0
MSPGRDAPLSVGEGVRMMFYALSPNESSFETLHEVPNYVAQAVPYFWAMILLEVTLCWYKGTRLPRVNDTVSSVSAGMLSQLAKLLTRSVELSAFIFVHDRYRVASLPWDSPLTWGVTFLGVDLGYYWFHRLAHEVNVMWAAHQVHHSSEYYNLSTALRQSVVQPYTSWVFYLPMALFIPPPIFIVHIQLNLLYQFWIHTEMISSLGPLEHVLNTPSHHRVHHGRNPYCIDKNYGGTLIIWDRLFGTFQWESEKVVYGLTHNINTFNPWVVQYVHFRHIWRTLWTTPGWCHRLWVVIKGPGWAPGKPRLGCLEDIPKITGGEAPYDPAHPGWVQAYVVAHYALGFGAYEKLMAGGEAATQAEVLALLTSILLALSSYSFIMDKRPYAAPAEAARCALQLACHLLQLVELGLAAQVVFASSMVIWSLRSLRVI